MNNKGVLIPVGDIEVSVILRNKSKLEEFFVFSSSGFDIVEKLLNKRIFYKTIDKLDILCPKTYILNDESDVEKIRLEINILSCK